MLRKVRLLPFLPLALLVVLAVRALRPLVTIRLGPLTNVLIGSFARDPEVYLCERDAGYYGRKAIDIFYCQGTVSNGQLKKMWGRALNLCQLASIPDRLNRRLPGGQSHVIPWRANISRDIDGLLSTSVPHLHFTEQEEQLGRDFLRQSGIADGGNFACFHARDTAFRAVNFASRDDYHNKYRNASIINYLPAAEELAGRGYFSFRMGAVVEQPLPATASKVIDYATNGRTDFLDIYLTAKCRFFFGSGSGIDSVSMIFRRPTIYANYVPLKHFPAHGPEDLVILKKHWQREEGRYLTFREIMHSGAGEFLTTTQFDQLGIEVVENTPEDITALVIEMDERLNDTWQAMDDDEELQARFWSLFEPNHLSRVYLSRIGAEFLRQNRELLN